jgi:hypothetical protein
MEMGALAVAVIGVSDWAEAAGEEEARGMACGCSMDAVLGVFALAVVRCGAAGTEVACGDNYAAMCTSHQEEVLEAVSNETGVVEALDDQALDLVEGNQIRAGDLVVRALAGEGDIGNLPPPGRKAHVDDSYLIDLG